MAKLTARGTHEVNGYTRRREYEGILFLRTIVVRSDDTVLERTQSIRDGKLEPGRFTISKGKTQMLRTIGVEAYMRRLARWETRR